MKSNKVQDTIAADGEFRGIVGFAARRVRRVRPLLESDPAVGAPVPIELRACSDGTATPCSSGRDLDLVGFKTTGRASSLPAGPARVRITASNLADPVLSLDFRYNLVVLPTTATASTLSAGAR